MTHTTRDIHYGRAVRDRSFLNPMYSVTISSLAAEVLIAAFTFGVEFWESIREHLIIRLAQLSQHCRHVKTNGLQYRDTCRLRLVPSERDNSGMQILFRDNEQWQLPGIACRNLCIPFNDNTAQKTSRGLDIVLTYFGK